jgi:hypothetical protein
MRRLLLLLAGLLALACAGRTKLPNAAAPAQNADPATAIPGMEPQPGEVLTEIDTNRDGRPDVWKYVRKDGEKDVLVRRERDLNGDGRKDSWEAYGLDGQVQNLVYDLDFDGKPDVTLTFEKGQLVQKEYALGFEGTSRSWSFFEKGKLVRKERDTNGDGKVDYWEYWENGEVDRIGQDLDGDGQVDKWESRKSAAEADATAQAPAQK